MTADFHTCCTSAIHDLRLVKGRGQPPNAITGFASNLNVTRRNGHLNQNRGRIPDTCSQIIIIIIIIIIISSSPPSSSSYNHHHQQQHHHQNCGIQIEVQCLSKFHLLLCFALQFLWATNIFHIDNLTFNFGLNSYIRGWKWRLFDQCIQHVEGYHLTFCSWVSCKGDACPSKHIMEWAKTTETISYEDKF